MSNQELMQAIAAETAKGAPPIYVAYEANAHGWTGADIVTALTIIYLVLQILWLLWKWWKSSRNGEVEE